MQRSAHLILQGVKTIEIRGSRTFIRGRIGIIISGTKKVWGTVEVYDCIELTKDLFEDIWKDKHKSSRTYNELLQTYSRPYAWLLRDAKQFDEPVPYNHKQGCVIWVNLDKDIFSE